MTGAVATGASLSMNGTDSREILSPDARSFRPSYSLIRASAVVPQFNKNKGNGRRSLGDQEPETALGALSDLLFLRSIHFSSAFHTGDKVLRARVSIETHRVINSLLFRDRIETR